MGIRHRAPLQHLATKRPATGVIVSLRRQLLNQEERGGMPRHLHPLPKINARIHARRHARRRTVRRQKAQGGTHQSRRGVVGVAARGHRRQTEKHVEMPRKAVGHCPQRGGAKVPGPSGGTLLQFAEGGRLETFLALTVGDGASP